VDRRDRAAVNALLEAAQNAADEGAWSSTHRIVRPDGTVRWISVNGRRYYRDTPKGRRAVRSIGTVVDVTHLKESEEASPRYSRKEITLDVPLRRAYRYRRRAISRRQHVRLGLARGGRYRRRCPPRARPSARLPRSQAARLSASFTFTPVYFRWRQLSVRAIHKGHCHCSPQLANS
jgi:hypothetical protein